MFSDVIISFCRIYYIFLVRLLLFILKKKRNKKTKKKSKVLNHSYLFWFKQEITKKCFYFLHDY